MDKISQTSKREPYIFSSELENFWGQSCIIDHFDETWSVHNRSHLIVRLIVPVSLAYQVCSLAVHERLCELILYHLLHGLSLQSSG